MAESLTHIESSGAVNVNSALEKVREQYLMGLDDKTPWAEALRQLAKALQPYQDGLKKLLHDLSEGLRALVKPLSQAVPIQEDILLNGILIFVACILLILCVWLIRRYGESLQLWFSRLFNREKSQALEPVGESHWLTTPADQLFAQARQLAQQGRLAEAVTRLHLACVTVCFQRGWIADNPALSNGDVRRTLAQAGQQRILEAFGVVSRYQEAVTYGRIPPQADEVSRCLGCYEPMTALPPCRLSGLQEGSV
jgi:hypothetical protein